MSEPIRAVAVGRIGASSVVPVRDHDELNIETTLRGIDPRADKDTVLMIIGRALDNCDPGERPAIQVTRWPGQS